jgi:hypothetical protein
VTNSTLGAGGLGYEGGMIAEQLSVTAVTEAAATLCNLIVCQLKLIMLGSSLLENSPHERKWVGVGVFRVKKFES